jgi:Family of unknown function (DUF6982)/PilZ domain
VPLQDRFSAPILIRRNRRAYPRLAADQLRWLKRVRLKYGPAVSLIDLSVHGAFFEVESRLRLGDETNLELVAADERADVTGHIVRTEVIGLTADAVLYRGACEFEGLLPWGNLLSAMAPPLQPPVIQATDYQPWNGWSEVRLLFLHGRRLHGYTRGFHPSEPALNVWPSCAASDRERQTLPLSLLRTVVFVADLDEDGRSQPSQRPDARSLTPVEVTFRNNDVVRGMTPGYDPGQVGFWVLPSHHLEQARVFAVSSTVREICLL